jgi:hypothetical protein
MILTVPIGFCGHFFVMFCVFLCNKKTQMYLIDSCCGKRIYKIKGRHDYSICSSNEPLSLKTAIESVKLPG